MPGSLRGWLVVIAIMGSLGGAATSQAQGACDPSFPQGNVSFADDVVEFSRGTFGRSGQPNNALGGPNADNGSVTLGNGGTLTIRFSDNALTGSGNSDPDLYIFESGPLQELVTVEISADGNSFFAVGQTSGQCGFIDIDEFGFGPGEEFFYVRVTDILDDQYRENSSAGAEINAIGAISTEVVTNPGGGGNDNNDNNDNNENRPPVAEDDRYDVDQDESTHFDGDKGVLDNDDDPDGDNLTAAIDEQPNHGHVDMNDNGAFTYIPDPDFHGGDAFTYWAKDGQGNRSRGRVDIHVSQAEREDEPGAAFTGDGGVSAAAADGGVVATGVTASGDNTGNAAAVDAAIPLADPASDDDGDGLTYELERKAYDTDPWLWDSDGDGVSDGDEVATGANPLVAEAAMLPSPAEPTSTSVLAEPVPAADPGLAPAVAPAIAAPAAAAAAPDLSCTAYPDWLTVQSAYEAAGRTAADPALVNAIDPDWDGIACEDGMQP